MKLHFCTIASLMVVAVSATAYASLPNCSYQRIGPGMSCQVLEPTTPSFTLVNDTTDEYTSIHDSYTINLYDDVYKKCDKTFRGSPVEAAAFRKQCVGKAVLRVIQWKNVPKGSTQKLSDIAKNNNSHFSTREWEACRNFEYNSWKQMGYCVWF